MLYDEVHEQELEFIDKLNRDELNREEEFIFMTVDGERYVIHSKQSINSIEERKLYIQRKSEEESRGVLND